MKKSFATFTAIALLLLAALYTGRPATAKGQPAPLEDRSVTGAEPPPAPLEDQSVTGESGPPPPLEEYSIPATPAPPTAFEGHSVTGAPASGEQKFRQALKEHESGKYMLAAATALQAVKLSGGTPWEGRLEFLAARAYAAEGKLDAASALFASARRKLPLLGDYTYYVLAGAYAKAGLHGEAQAAYESLLKGYPDSLLMPDAQVNQAEEMIASGRHQAALECLKPLVDGNKAGRLTARARYLLMLAYEGKGDRASAISQYRTLWLEYPYTREVKDADAALKRLKEAGATLQEFSAEDHVKRADSLYRRGQYAGAIEDYRHALKAMPEGWAGRWEVYYRLGLAYYRTRQNTECESALNTALTANPPLKEAPDALYWLARVYLRTGDTVRFRDAALLAGFGYPENHRSDDSLYLLGVTLSQDGDHDSAIEIFNIMLSMHPNSQRTDEALWQKGWASFMKGDYTSADKSLAALTSSFPGSVLVPQALHWRARALAKMGDKAQAGALSYALAGGHPLSFYGLIPPEADSITVGQGKGLNFDPAYPRVRDSYNDPRLARAYELGLQGMSRGAERELKRAETVYCTSLEGIKAIAGLYGFLGRFNRPLELASDLYRTGLSSGSGGIPGDALSLIFPLGYWDTVKKEAAGFGLDPFLLSALIREESRYNRDAVSPAGAIGLMQLMPGTAKTMCRIVNVTYRSPDGLKDERVNVPLGACYLKTLMDKHNGRLVYVLAEYNAGPSALAKWKAEMPDKPDDLFIEGIDYQETRNYVKRVLRNYYIYRMLYGDSKADSHGAVSLKK